MSGSLYTVTTESGAVYEIDTYAQFWRKNQSSVERIWWCYGIPHEEALKLTGWPAMTGVKQAIPKVGEHLYIGSRDVWWISSPVTKVTRKKSPRQRRDEKESREADAHAD